MTLGLLRSSVYDTLEIPKEGHELIIREVDGKYHVMCNFLTCKFEDVYETPDDVIDGATGHETVTE